MTHTQGVSTLLTDQVKACKSGLDLATRRRVMKRRRVG